MNKQIAAAIAACTQLNKVQPSQNPNPSQGDNYLVILPLGKFKGVDGRPDETADGHWHLSVDNANAIATAVNANKAELFIDYDHQSLHKAQNGQPAPAAGWASNLVVIDGIGLCAQNWRWTPKAAQAIADEEYRYISPVFLYDPTTGDVTDLINVGLVNEPNIDELPEAALAAAGRLINLTNNAPIGESMNLEELLERLRYLFNLPTLATVDDVKASLDQLQSRLEAAPAVAANSKGSGAKPSVLQLLDQAAETATAEPDPTQYVPIGMYNQLQATVAQLSANSKHNEATALIAQATADGKLMPDEASQKWAMAFCSRDLEGFKQHIAAAPKILALTTTQTSQTATAANSQKQGGHVVDEATLAVAAQMGVDASTLSV